MAKVVTETAGEEPHLDTEEETGTVRAAAVADTGAVTTRGSTAVTAVDREVPREEAAPREDAEEAPVQAEADDL
jgi:hypothetical protein